MSKLEKIEKVVVEGYQKIENGVVEGYKKIEEGAVEGFQKVSDKFVEKLFTKEGETVEEAKARLAEEQYERTEKGKECKHTHVEIPDSKEIVKKNLEASLNAGKRNILLLLFLIPMCVG